MTFKEFMRTECGYDCVTTFWEDFSIADNFGVAAIRDTYKRAFSEWKSNIIYLTELVMVLNHKIAQHYRQGNMEYAKVYDELWEKADIWASENLSEKDYSYYYKTLD